MLINRIEDAEAKGDCESGTNNVTSYAHEYQTANELFDLMTKEHSFNDTGDDSLTTRDLVILYENIEMGTKLISDAKQVKRSNQLVETVVYNDESESEVSDNYSNADLINLCRANEETLNLLQSNSSYENTLCRKISRMEIQTSIHRYGHEKFFLFRDPLIKDHLKNLRSSCMDFESQLLPSTLLDYLCCKRLEENYTFHMDNIIRHVTHTIEQLKRISNGDYLTEKAKEMWKEVHDENIHIHTSKINSKSTKMIATRTRFPLHIERKITGTSSCWDDIVHSEIDLRSLSKVLEKKIFLEVPKIICGSFKLFSKQCAENLIIRCKQSCSEESVTKDTKESHVDVVLQLERSETGQVMSTVNSIMILEAIPKVQVEETAVMLALPHACGDEPRDDLEVTEMSHKEDYEKSDIREENKSVSIIEGDEINLSYTSDCLPSPQKTIDIISKLTYNKTFTHEDEDDKSNCSNYSEYAQQDSNDACSEDKDGMAEELKSTLKEVIQSQSMSHDLPHRGLVCDELHLTMRSLVMPDTLPEENEESSTIPPKNKSPTRVRVKSPYENKSRAIEEKKRKKLLEIKERRERKRNSLNENNKVTKHKFNNRSSVMPQASGSVTKLSISNKSFYNSIYGKNLELENINNNTRYRKKEPTSDVSLNESEKNDYVKDIIQLPSKDNLMVNDYLYLDETATEIEMTGSVLESNSAEPNLCPTGLIVLNQLERPSLNEIKEIHTKQLQEKLDESDLVNSEPYSDALPHVNITYNTKETVKDSPSRITTTDDCRESIDKLYDLMNKLENPITSINDYCPMEIKTKKTVDIDIADIRATNLTIHNSESGSVMQQSISSIASNISLVRPVSKSTKTRNIEPKVIISSKNQQNTNENNKKNRKMYHTSHGSNVKPVDQNPLKAISQLLHNIENVQKIRKKATFDTKVIKKSEEPQKENKYRLRFNIDNKRQSDDLNRRTTDKYLHFNSNIPRAVPRTNLTIQSPRQILKPPSEDKHTNFTKKKMSDILDEVKEARGEAVRGPVKFNSRLNTLAQPKKSYVQAHNQEYQSKYGRSLAADRLQRLAVAERSSNMRNKQRRGGHESPSVKPLSASSVPPIETSRRKRSRSSSPIERVLVGAKYTQKSNNGSASLVPKPTAVLESCIKSYYVHENSTKILLQQPLPQGSTKLRDFNTSSRLQPPTHSLEYLEIKNNLNDSINTMISTIPLDYKKSDPDMKINSYPLLTKFTKMDSLIAEDGSFDEEEELFYEQSTIESTNSKDSELTRLETALNCQNLSDVFQKRLRIKNLTLTPKPSSKHVLIVHSGDGSSVVLKSKISQKFKVNTSKSEINYYTNIPLQMFTVGYAFQQYQTHNAKSKGEDYVRPKGSIVSFSQNFIPNPIQKKISDVNANIKRYKVTEIDHSFKSKKQKDIKLKYSASACEVFSKVGNTKYNSCNELICITEGNGAMTSPTIDDNVKLSTSLDILVQLLGEIKNITTCQSQISPPVYDSKEVKDIFNNIAFQKENVATKVIDVSTSIQNDLNNFSQLNNDHHELYQRNILQPKSYSTVSCYKKPTVFDKEIDVKLNQKEYENKVTEIPSQMLMFNISQSTSITNSLLGLYCKPSTQIKYSVSEHRSMTRTSIDSKRKSMKFPIQKYDNQDKLLAKLADNKQIVSKPTVIFKKNNCALLKNKSMVDHNVKRYKLRQHLNMNSSGFDNAMKLKRDVLVTIYSILVVTIFAALSLPQVF